MIDTTLESYHQKKCNDLLRELGILFWHDEAGQGGRNRKAHRGNKPDLMFFHGAKFYAFEVKRTGEKLREGQADILKRLALEGGAIVGWGDYLAFCQFLSLNKIIIKDSKP